jgi:hypothetical protein
VATEWVAALALLLFPVVVLVATLPTWAERRNAATIAAREAARTIANEWPRPAQTDANRVAREVAADFGIAADDITVVAPSGPIPRGGVARVEVWVTMPAVSVASVRAGSWRYRAVAVRRIDDYRSA